MQSNKHETLCNNLSANNEGEGNTTALTSYYNNYSGLLIPSQFTNDDITMLKYDELAEPDKQPAIYCYCTSNYQVVLLIGSQA